MKPKLLFLFILIFACLVSSTSAAIVHINTSTVNGYNLGTANNTYILDNNVTANGTAFYVGANNITFDGQGFTITYSLISNAAGISSNGYDFETIKNVNIVSGSPSNSSARGISLLNTVTDANIENVSISSGAAYGLYCAPSATRIYVNNTTAVSTINAAFYLNTASDSYISYSTFISNTSYGAYPQLCTNVTLYRCTITSTAGTSAYIYQDTACTLNGCTVNSDTGLAAYCNASDNSSIINTIATSNARDGIYILNSNNCTISGSTGRSINDTGIFIKYSNASTVSSSTGSSYNYTGFYAEDVNYTTFNGITCVSDTKDGLKLNRVFYPTYSGIVVNSPFATTSPNGKTHMLVVGDSITEGNTAESVAGGYGRYITPTLGSNYIASIQGVGGDHSEFLDQMINDKLGIFNPDIVVILIGTNDLFNGRPQQNIINEILDIANKSRASGATPYILTLIPRATTTDAATIALNINLTMQANAAGYHVINTYDMLDSLPSNGQYNNYDSQWYIDGVHPTNTANQLMGARIAGVMLDATTQETLVAHAANSNQFVTVNESVANMNMATGDNLYTTIIGSITSGYALGALCIIVLGAVVLLRYLGMM